MGFVVHLVIMVLLFVFSALSYFAGGALEAASAVPNMSVDITLCNPLLFHQGAYRTIPIGMLQMCAA